MSIRSNSSKVLLALTCLLSTQIAQMPAFAQPSSITPESFESLTGKGENLRSTGDLKQAGKALNLAYQQARNFAADDVRRMKATENLARVLEIEGRYATAESLFREALDLRQDAYGESSRTSKSYYNIGRVQLLAGNYPAARKNLEKALELRESASVSEDMPLGYIHYSLGVLESETGNFDKAVEHLNHSQAIAQHNARHKESARILSELATVSLAQGDFPKARNQATTAFGLAEQYAKDDVVVRSQALDAVAKVQLVSGEPKQAIIACSEAWRLRRTVLGADHPITADSLLTSGLIKMADGQYEDAQHDFDQALGVFNQTRNQQHLCFARAMMGRSFAHLRQRDRSASEKDFAHAINLYKGSGASHVHGYYRDLFVKNLGAHYNLLELAMEKVKSPSLIGGKLDSFGQMLTASLSAKQPEDMFYFFSFKDVFSVLGVTFILLVLLAMAVMIPNSLACFFSTGNNGSDYDEPEISGPTTRRRRQSTDSASRPTQSTPTRDEKPTPSRSKVEADKMQVQVWRNRLSTMELENPDLRQPASDSQFAASSGNYERFDFNPQMPPPPPPQQQQPPVQSDKPRDIWAPLPQKSAPKDSSTNDQEFKW